MAVVKLTMRSIDALSSTGKTILYWDSELSGFGLIITAAGAKSYVVKYPLPNGASRRATIGRFGVLTLEQARSRARVVLAEARITRTDPIARAVIEERSLDDAFAAWMDQHVRRKLSVKSAESYQKFYRSSIAPRLGSQRIVDLKRRTVAELHTEMAEIPAAANHMIRTLRALLRWAERQQLVTFVNGNPAQGHTLYEERPSDRILSVTEIHSFIKNLPGTAMTGASQRCLLLELLTGQRSGEIAGMQRAEVDLPRALWTIAATRTKNGSRHEVPLGPWARDVVAAALAESDRSDFVFPSQVAEKSLDSHTLSQACRRAQRRPSGINQSKHTWFDFVAPSGESNPFSPHDLRRTCSSYMEMLGHSEAVRAAILNHISTNSVTAKHYSAGDLLRMKRTAILEWEGALRVIAKGDDPFAQSIEDDRAEETRILGDLPMPATGLVALSRKPK